MIEEKRLKENVEVFSFPRIFGSKAEKRAYNLAREKIEELNLEVKSQEFHFTNYYSHIYSRIMFVIIFWLLMVLYLNIGGLFQNINFLIIAIMSVLLFISSRKPENIKIGKRFQSQNLYATIDSTESKRTLIFIAHLDSKGQRFDITDRVRIFILWAGSFLISLSLILLKNLVFMDIALIFYICGGIMLGINLFGVLRIFQNVTGNHSQGALDDASGIACVIELLTYYSNPKNRLNNYNYIFLLTGAEECGTIGIRKFYDIVKNNGVDKKQTIVLNFDSIGTTLDLIKFGLTTHRGLKLMDIFLEKAYDYGLNIKTRNVPIGVHTDGYYLFKKGFKGLEFGDWDSYQYLHTVRDTINKIDISLLKNLCQILIESLKEVDNLY